MTSQMRDTRGFSLIELLVSMFIMTVVLGLSTRALIQAMHTDEAIGLMADANQSLQSAQTMMVRDLVDAGRNLISAAFRFPAAGPRSSGLDRRMRPPRAGRPATILYAVTPGNELGPTLNGNTTDVVTIVSVDDSLQHGEHAVIVRTATGATVTLIEEPDVRRDPPQHPPSGRFDVGDESRPASGAQRDRRRRDQSAHLLRDDGRRYVEPQSADRDLGVDGCSWALRRSIFLSILPSDLLTPRSRGSR